MSGSRPAAFPELTAAHPRADSVLAELQGLRNASTRLFNALPEETKGAFFQLVHHPVQASLTLADMWISAGINNLRASQARISANDFMTSVEQLFDDDYALEVDYHTILNGELALPCEKQEGC